MTWLLFVVNFSLQLMYSVRAMTGEAHSLANHGREKSLLILRTLFPIVLDVVLLVPFAATEFFKVIQTRAGQLLFTKPGMHISVVTFLRELNLEVPYLGPTHANQVVM